MSNNLTKKAINISSQNVYGKCDLKCVYNFKYKESVLTVKNNGVNISLSYDNSNVPPVLYNEEKYEETRKALDKIKDKIKKYRKAGLDKGGEMATENLVFKTMRRSGLMEKIYDLGLETTDKQYTIETLGESKK